MRFKALSGWIHCLLKKKRGPATADPPRPFTIGKKKRPLFNRYVVLNDIEPLKLPKKICEKSRPSKPDTGTRGSSSPEAVHCAECAGQSRSDEAKEVDGIPNKKLGFYS